MEDNNAQNVPISCANGCGFYGNPINNNMCSKCFKEVGGQKPIQTDSTGAALTAPQQKQNLPALPITHLTPAADTTPPSSSSSPSSSLVQAPLVVEQPSAPVPATASVSVPVAVEHKQEPSVSQQQQQQHGPSPTTSSTVVMDTTPDSAVPGERAVQVNKGRCFMCRAKIPLAKQAINKCRCDYVFCDTHKATAKHDCDFDFAKMGKEQLTKANPKLNDKPRGGRSFTRLD